MSYIWKEDQKELSFEEGPDSTGLGNRIFGTFPHTCIKGQELQDGLCYEKCRKGYHGIGPVCWADTHNRGIGKVLIPESCDDSGYGGWRDTGLLCNEPITPNKCKFRGLFNECWPGLDGGRVMPKKLSCKAYGPSRPDQKDSLCYESCPKDKPNSVPGMPYLCMEGDTLSYGRGAGTIPPILKFGNGS